MKVAQDAVDYVRLFDSLPTPYIAVRPDADLTIVAQNAAHVKVALTKPREVLGKPLLVAFPDTSPKFKKTGVSDIAESFRKAARTGKPDTLPVVQFDLQDGPKGFVERWWRVTHYPVFNAAHEVVLVYQATEDITSEINSKHQLDLTQSQLDSALEIGLVSTWTWDIARDIVMGDRNLAQYFGISITEMQRGLPLQRFVDSIHPEDQQRVSDSISKAVSAGTVYETEYRVINARKKLQWMVARGKVIKDTAGQPEYFLGILIDITARKKAEADLLESKRMFDALFGSNIVAIAMADTRGNIYEANETFLKLFGYTKTDLKRGLTSNEISATMNDSITQRIYNSLRQKGEAEPTDKRYRRKDGSEFPALVGAAMLPGSSDRFLAFILDVSENERLKEVNQAKDEFIALASHQLRTPASAVKQYLGVVMEEYAGPISEDQLQYLTIANNANNRQLEIINDLLKTAQIDTTGFQLNISPHNLVPLVTKVINEYLPTLDAKNQFLNFKTSDDNIILPLDTAEMSICMANLIENASKYSLNGAKISVTVVAHSKHAEIRVSDQGVGIAKQDQDKIFEKFTRVNNELSDTVTGNGLGLYWVRRIVDLHKGDLRITSKVGKGTTFTVRLPI